MKRRDALKRSALLGGTALVSGSLLTLLQSCKETPRLDWQPSFLNMEQAQLVSALVDTILPKTDTPGGLDVKADMFIDKAIKNTFDEAGQKKIVGEMDAFNEKCKSKYGKVFHELDAGQRTELLTEEEANSPKFNRGVWGTAVGEQKPVGFYRAFKSMAIWAYCSSEEIGKNVLNYDPIPKEYRGCVPLSEVGKVWTL